MARTPTLLQRIKQLSDDDVINGDQRRSLIAMERDNRNAARGVVAELNITLSDLLGTKGEYIACRAMRHWWDDAEFTWDYNPMGTPEVQRCARCDMVRIQIYAYNGRRNGNARYKQPEGYSFSGVGRRLTSADFNIIRRYLKLAEMVSAFEHDPSTAQLELLQAQ